MAQFLLSLDEIERVKAVNGISSTSGIAECTGMSRATWTRAMKSRRPTPDILDALAKLGADPHRILVQAQERSPNVAA